VLITNEIHKETTLTHPDGGELTEEEEKDDLIKAYRWDENRDDAWDIRLAPPEPVVS
jgi:hypothetical protein